MPTLHINAAHTSISQAYHFIAIYYQSDQSIPLLYKTLFLRNIISTSVSRHTDNTRALYPSHNTACFVTARLAVQLNGIIQNHSTCRFVVTTQLHFHQVINHNACCRKGIFKNCCSQFIPFDFIHRYSQSNGYTPKLRPTARLFPVPPTSLVLHNCILQVVNHCLLFIWCFFKKNCFVTPSFNTVGFTHIDYVSNDIEISMMYQSDKHIASCLCAAQPARFWRYCYGKIQRQET